MTKQEFLEKLRISLNGKIAANQVEEHIRYYEDYINVEIRKGRSEEEVMAALGEPRLIARTIVETTGRAQSSEYDSTDSQYGGDDKACQEYNRGTEVRNLSKVPGWVWIILVILIVIIILGAVFSVITALMPVLLPVLLVVLLVKIFRDR